MPGRAIITERLQMLEEMGEDAIFDLYLELGSLQKVIKKIWKPKGRAKSGDYGRRQMYQWLHQEPGRWERWQDLQRQRGDVEADLVLEHGEQAKPSNASSQRLKVDVHKWRAERLNRERYGPPQQQVNVGVQIGSSWLQALRELEAETEIVNEPPPTLESGGQPEARRRHTDPGEDPEEV